MISIEGLRKIGRFSRNALRYTNLIKKYIVDIDCSFMNEIIYYHCQYSS